LGSVYFNTGGNCFLIVTGYFYSGDSYFILVGSCFFTKKRAANMD
jgi:hypothetical protein